MKGQAVPDKPELSEAEWREKLSPEQYHVLREAGTERAFTGKYDKHYDEGEYYCAGCGQKLFESEDKYNSGCGWPAFTAPAEGEAVDEHRDTSHGMIRTEVTCSNCGGHLGHPRRTARSRGHAVLHQFGSARFRTRGLIARNRGAPVHARLALAMRGCGFYRAASNKGACISNG